VKGVLAVIAPVVATVAFVMAIAACGADLNVNDDQPDAGPYVRETHAICRWKQPCEIIASDAGAKEDK